MREIYNVRCLGLKGDENHGRCWLLRPLCLIKYSDVLTTSVSLRMFSIYWCAFKLSCCRILVYLLHFLLLKINCHTYLFLCEISMYNVLLCPLWFHSIGLSLNSSFSKLWIYTFLFLEGVFALHSLCSDSLFIIHVLEYDFWSTSLSLQVNSHKLMERLNSVRLNC